VIARSSGIFGSHPRRRPADSRRLAMFAAVAPCAEARPDLVSDRIQRLHPRRQEIAVARNYAVQLPEERAGFFG
jgi:hypothetical protein